MKNLITIVLGAVLLLSLRYDFTHNLFPYKVQSSDTLWSILDSKVFHNSAITGLSIEYLKNTKPKAKWDYIQANKSADNGYTLSIFMGKMSILAPNKQYIVEKVALLPDSALWNHAVQVLIHDIVIISLALFIYVAFHENGFRISPDLVATLFIIPLLIAVMIPVCLLLLVWIIRIVDMIVSPQNLMIINR